MALPTDGACVVVHNAAMVRYVERMICDLRGKDMMKLCKVLRVESQRDAVRLHGLNIRTFVDHAFWDLTRDKHVARYVNLLVDRINMQFPDMKAAA
ncbi:hypothetical protein [Agrobacterium sp. RC10-4-1]|uniref:hypothetical protein n=1 Tax=Agrobacterium sp. RC10-4-1 TaxID=2587039 RepID=UPI0015FD4211|nr:hypothetical protein [Agrobacterium sp. RC10-4-1]